MDPKPVGEAPFATGEFPGTNATGKHFGIVARNPPRKSTARLLWAVFSLFVVYGTTFPFHFRFEWPGFLALTQRFSWVLLGGTPDNPLIADIVQNILLFIPFGFLGYFSLIYKSSLLKKTGIILAGASLSAFVEFLQAFSFTRYPAISDVIFNTLGTLVGLGLAVLLKKSVLGFKSHPVARRFLDSESAYPAFIFLTLAIVGCWQPFDFGLDISVPISHLNPLLENPFSFSRPKDDLFHFIQFLLTSLFICRLAHESKMAHPVKWGTLCVGSLALFLEASQLIIQSGTPEFQDAIVSLLGVAVGGVLFFFPGFHLRPGMWTLAGGVAIFLSAALRGLHPFNFVSQFSGFNWVLFLPAYERTTFAAIGNFLESAIVFFPMGFLLGYFFPRIKPSLLAAAVAGLLAMMVECAQGFVPGRYSDITDVLGAMLGGLAGGLALTRGWPAFREYMREEDDTQV